jgi:hydrogenase expression/formation protein HypC
MCLAIPGIVRRIDGCFGDIDIGGIETRANLLFTPEARVGEFVIVHAGFAIAVMGREDAKKTLELLGELEALDEQ